MSMDAKIYVIDDLDIELDGIFDSDSLKDSYIFLSSKLWSSNGSIRKIWKESNDQISLYKLRSYWKGLL